MRPSTNGSFTGSVRSFEDSHMSAETVLDCVMETVVKVTSAYALVSEYCAICNFSHTDATTWI
jgi:hypothetical protein